MMRSYFADDITGLPEMGPVARQLWETPGCGPADIQTAVIYDHFTPFVLTQLEEFGFCGRGEAKDFIRDGNIELGGGLPVNTHGGQLGEALPARDERHRRGRAPGARHLRQPGRRTSSTCWSPAAPACPPAGSSSAATTDAHHRGEPHDHPTATRRHHRRACCCDAPTTTAPACSSRTSAVRGPTSCREGAPAPRVALERAHRRPLPHRGAARQRARVPLLDRAAPPSRGRPSSASTPPVAARSWRATSRHTDCQMVVTDRAHLDLLDGLDLGLPADRVLLGRHRRVRRRLLAHAATWTAADVGRPSTRATPCSCSFTSGSTGAPKAVVCSQGRFAGIAQVTPGLFGVTDADVCYSAMPMFHGNALMASWALGPRQRRAVGHPPQVLGVGLPARRAASSAPPTSTTSAVPSPTSSPPRERPDEPTTRLRLAFGTEATRP